MDISDSVMLDRAQDVSSVCQPFFNKLNINYFDYCKIFKDGSMSVLSNDSYHVRHFFEVEYPAGGTIQKTGIYPWSLHLPAQAITDAKNYFNHTNGVTFLTEHEDHIEFFDFATPRDNHGILYYYYNRPDIFELFCLYFKECACELISEADSKRITLAKDMCVTKSDSYNDLIAGSLDIIKPKKYWFKHNGRNSKVTQTEMNCLLQIAKGMTIKETSSALSIAQKTVETHIYNIKNRLNVHTKSELIGILQKQFKNFFMNNKLP